MWRQRNSKIAVAKGATDILVAKPVTLSGKAGDDAKKNQERAVSGAIAEFKS
jgi:hypothetical protein